MTTVTKSKGRVESGKRLAEWNRQKRLSNKAKQNILSGEPQAVDASIDTPRKDPPKTDSYLIYGIAVIGIGYTAYTLWKNKSPTKEEPKQEPTPQVQIDNDPFQMY